MTQNNKKELEALQAINKVFEDKRNITKADWEEQIREWQKNLSMQAKYGGVQDGPCIWCGMDADLLIKNINEIVSQTLERERGQIIKMIEGMERLKLAHDIQLGTDVDLISKYDILSNLHSLDNK